MVKCFSGEDLEANEYRKLNGVRIRLNYAKLHSFTLATPKLTAAMRQVTAYSQSKKGILMQKMDETEIFRIMFVQLLSLSSFVCLSKRNSENLGKFSAVKKSAASPTCSCSYISFAHVSNFGIDPKPLIDLTFHQLVHSAPPGLRFQEALIRIFL